MSNLCNVDLGNYNSKGRGLSSISNEDSENHTLINQRGIQKGPFDSPIVYPHALQRSSLSMTQNYLRSQELFFLVSTEGPKNLMDLKLVIPSTNCFSHFHHDSINSQLEKEG